MAIDLKKQEERPPFTAESIIDEGQNSFLDVARCNIFLKDGFLIFCRKSTSLILGLLDKVKGLMIVPD